MVTLTKTTDILAGPVYYHDSLDYLKGEFVSLYLEHLYVFCER